MATLAEKRAQWEKGLTVVAEIPVRDGTKSLAVVLKDDRHAEGHGWHLHFYMTFGGNEDGYDVSADVQRGSAERVFKALAERFT